MSAFAGTKEAVALGEWRPDIMSLDDHSDLVLDRPPTHVGAPEADAWPMVIAWGRATLHQPDCSLACNADSIQRIANVLRSMRPRLRRGKPHAATGHLHAHFTAHYALPRDNAVAPGDKHGPLRVVFEAPDVSLRTIVIMPPVRYGW